MNVTSNVVCQHLPLEVVAKTCGVSVRTVRRWLEVGLPFSQPIPRGRIIIKTDDLNHFLDRFRSEQGTIKNGASATSRHLKERNAGSSQRTKGNGKMQVLTH